MFLGFTLEICTGLMRGATVKPSKVLKGENRCNILDSRATLEVSRLHSVQRHFFLIRQGSDRRCGCCNFKAESSCICCLLPACPLSSSLLLESPSINLQRIKKKIGVCECPYGAPKLKKIDHPCRTSILTTGGKLQLTGCLADSVLGKREELFLSAQKTNRF